MTEPEPDEEARNRQLWALIVAHHTAIARRLAYRTGNRDLAEDLAQQVWLRVGANLGWYVNDPHPLEKLMRVAHDLAHNHFRREQRHGEQRPGADAITALSDNSIAERLWRGVRLLGPDRRNGDSRAVPYAGVDSRVDPMFYADLRVDLGEAVGQLSARQQEALFLHYHDGLSPAGIAIQMNISRQAAEKLLGKAFTALRRSSRLAGWNEEEVDR